MTPTGHERPSRLAASTLRVGVFVQEHPAVGASREHCWCPNLRAILGYDPSRPPDLDWFTSRIHPEDRDRVRGVVERSQEPAGSGSFDLEFRWLHPRGELASLLVRGATTFGELDGGRAALRTFGALLDISPERALEAELTRHAAILDATPDLVATTDLRGYLTFLNRAGRAFLGLAPDEEIAPRNLGLAHPETMTDLMLNVAIPTAIRDGRWQGETDLVRHDGQVVTLSELLLSHRDAEGKVTHLSSLFHDLSRERELLEQFRQAHKMEAIGRLAGGIAHDFNNLLSAILGLTSLASDQLEPQHPARRELAEVVRAAERAAGLTGQLLAFCHKQLFQLRVLELNSTLADMEPLVRHLVGESILLSFVLTAAASRVRADPSQLQQVLLNLVVNARDSMPTGGELRIETRCIALTPGALADELELSPGPYVLLTVTDTGHGMSPEIRARIFDPFFTTKGIGQGTGLGLSTVFGIVKQTGGGLRVSSEPGHGTSVQIYLPCTDAPPTSEATPRPPVAAAVGGLLLVVEDDEQLRDVIARTLQRGGYDVLVAGTPAEALKLAASHGREIALVLTDVVMPGMSGGQLVARLRQDHPEVPVLYMSGYTADELIQRELLAASVGFLPKPFPAGRLLIAVAELLSRCATKPG